MMIKSLDLLFNTDSLSP